jgi:hypothetical protein
MNSSNLKVTPTAAIVRLIRPTVLIQHTAVRRSAARKACVTRAAPGFEQNFWSTLMPLGGPSGRHSILREARVLAACLAAFAGRRRGAVACSGFAATKLRRIFSRQCQFLRCDREPR